MQKMLALDLDSSDIRYKRHGSPREGSSLATETDLRGKPIRDAIAALTSGMLPEILEQLVLETFPADSGGIQDKDSQPLRVAWNLVSMCLTARISGNCSPKCSIHEAEKWFRGNIKTPWGLLSEQVKSENLWMADQLINTVELDREFRALLPYILEEHGPGSRASVKKNPKTAASRAAKREGGVFYTPADVAEYMVEHVRSLYCGEFFKAKCLDPACGTGVFFLAMLRAAARQHHDHGNFSRLDYITECLHGFDVSGQALDAAAFVLLQECVCELGARNISPLMAWKLIRRNLVETDALQVESKRTLAHFFEEPLPHLTKLFPNVANGFNILIGNPPYAAIGARKDFETLKSRFASLNGGKATQRSNMYPLFVEMMWRFTTPGCNASALVTPLSLSFHSGANYESCRQAMSWNGGQWQFAFFDREPHALFGEEVKTRNSILFRFENGETPRRGKTAIIETGPLRKWTSRMRKNLFQNIEFTSLDSFDITVGIPKVSGASQAEAFVVLKNKVDRLPSLAKRIGTCEIAEALSCEQSPKVFIGSTAYNFLNVYRPVSLIQEEHCLPLSESRIHILEFKTEAEACVAFAILSSRLTFWLWHVLGDGFHVAGWLCKSVPFGRNSFSSDDFASLSRLGDLLWQKLQGHRFTSVNGGKRTVGFRPLSFNEERDAIDVILVKAAGVKDKFVTELRTFVEKNAIVDTTDDRRKNMSKHFAENIIR